MSRLEAGLVILDLARHDVGDLIEAATLAFKSSAQEKGIVLSVGLPDQPLEPDCDGAWIELALSNLLDNALKFTPLGGRVEIGAERTGEAVHLGAGQWAWHRSGRPASHL